MKTKIDVQIHSVGEHSEAILKAIAVQNSGIASLYPSDLISYLKFRNALFPTCTNDLAYQQEDGTVNISKDGGKTFSLSLIWKEVHELEPELPTFEEMEEERKAFESTEEINDIPDNLFNAVESEIEDDKKRSAKRKYLAP